MCFFCVFYSNSFIWSINIATKTKQKNEHLCHTKICIEAMLPLQWPIFFVFISYFALFIALGVRVLVSFSQYLLLLIHKWRIQFCTWIQFYYTQKKNKNKLNFIFGNSLCRPETVVFFIESFLKNFMRSHRIQKKKKTTMRYF